MSMRARRIWLLIAVSAVVAAVGLRGGVSEAVDAEGGTSSGKIRLVTMPLAGPLQGKLYFEITAEEAGAPSSFKVDAANTAAVLMVTGARAGDLPIRVTYDATFNVTELEF